jgi:endonuclease/exonuclease/phosphatase family metal-dependent hydrolase
LLQGRQAGDVMIGLSGTTGQFRGLLQLQAPFNLVGSRPGEGPPEALPVTPHDLQPQSGTAENLESRLVALRDVTFTQSGAFVGGGTQGNYTVSNSEGLPVTVRVAHGDLPIVGQNIPSGRVNVTGIFSQNTLKNPPDDGYQLLLRMPGDLTASSSFDRWLTRHFIGSELRDPAVGAAAGDADGDGTSNLLEFALGGNPRAPRTAVLPTVSVGQAGDSQHLQLRFRRMAEAAEAVYRVEVSSDLKEWQTVWNSLHYPFNPFSGDWEVRTVPDPLPLHHAERRFIRLAVDAPDDRAPPPDEPEPLRIVTWNIEWFPGRKSNATLAEEQAHINAVRDYLAEVDPDVLLLQEIRDADSLAAAVALLDGYQVHIVSAFRVGGGLARQQLAIASRLTAQSAFAERFVAPANGDPTPPRGFAFAALELPGNRILLCYSLHLKSNASGDDEENIRIREESARQVLAHVADMRTLYANRKAIYLAVGGDFNVRLENPAMAHEQTIDLFKQESFHSTWDGVPLHQRVTWPGRGGWPDATFDYILLHNLGAPTARVLAQPTPDLSDHNPVEVTIQPQ